MNFFTKIKIGLLGLLGPYQASSWSLVIRLVFHFKSLDYNVSGNCGTTNQVCFKEIGENRRKVFFYFWTRQLACTTRIGIRKCSWPLLKQTFSLSSSSCIAFHPTWRVPGSWFSVCHLIWNQIEGIEHIFSSFYTF